MGTRLSDIREIKAELEIDQNDTVEDKYLLLLIEVASDTIHEYLGRDIGLQSRTEFYDGTNTQYLNLKSRPVYTTPTIQCWVDSCGYWGQANNSFQSPEDELTYGCDFVLDIDQPNGTSRSGVLVRMNEFWCRPYVRRPGLLSPYFQDSNGSIKVTYTAGYSIDTMPSVIRFACNTLVTRMRYLRYLGVPFGGDSYEGRGISPQWPQRNVLLDQVVKPLLFSYRNWKF